MSKRNGTRIKLSSRKKPVYAVNPSSLKNILSSRARVLYHSVMRNSVLFDGSVLEIDLFQKKDIDSRVDADIQAQIPQLLKVFNRAAESGVTGEEFTRIVEKIDRGEIIKRGSWLRNSKTFNLYKSQQALMHSYSDLIRSALSLGLWVPHRYCFVPEDRIPENLEELCRKSFLETNYALQGNRAFIEDGGGVRFQTGDDCKVIVKPIYEIRSNGYRFKMMVFHKGKVEGKELEDKLDVELKFTEGLEGKEVEITHYHAAKPYSFRVLAGDIVTPLLDEMEISFSGDGDQIAKFLNRGNDRGRNQGKDFYHPLFGTHFSFAGGPLLAQLAKIGKSPQYESFGFSLRKKLS